MPLFLAICGQFGLGTWLAKDRPKNSGRYISTIHEYQSFVEPLVGPRNLHMVIVQIINKIIELDIISSWSNILLNGNVGFEIL